MDKDNIFREVRKLIDILNTHGNCLVPSIHEDKRDTSAKERLAWIIDKAKTEHDMSVDDIQVGVNAL